MLRQIDDHLQTEHMQQNLEQYVNNSFSASTEVCPHHRLGWSILSKVCQKEEVLKCGFKIRVRTLVLLTCGEKGSDLEMESDEDDLMKASFATNWTVLLL